MDFKAIDALKTLAGPHRFREKCEAIGYRWEEQAAGTNLADNGVLVAKICSDEVVLADSLDPTAAQRNLTDDQFAELVRLDRWRVAVHEAGHVLAAVQLGFGVGHVSIHDDNSGEIRFPASEEFADLDDLDDHHDDDDYDLKQQFHAAGAAAEILMFSKYSPHGVSGDRRMVGGLERLKDSESGTSGDVFDTYVQLVLPKLNREDVRAIASALEKRGYLSGHRVSSILES